MNFKFLASIPSSTLWSVVPVVLVSVYGFTSFYGLSSLLDNQAWVAHTQQVISSTSEIEKLVVDLETGERGFLITGKEAFLQPYVDAQQKLIKKIDDTKDLVSDNPGQVKKIEKIEQLINDWLEEAAHVEIHTRRQVATGTVTAELLQQRLREGVGKGILDNIRQDLDSLDTLFSEAGNHIARNLVLAIAKDMVDQETGQRGFLITGEEAFLAPFTLGASQVNSHIAQLHDVVDNAYDRQMMLNDMEALKTLAHAWREEAAKPEIALREAVNNGTQSFNTISSVLSQGKGKNILDRFRKQASSINARFAAANNQEAQNTLLAIAKDMVDQETGQRGFLITGKQSFLAPYIAGSASLQEDFTKLTNMVNHAYGIHHARRLINRLSDNAKAWREQAGLPEIALRNDMDRHGTSINDVVALIELQTGKKIMDRLRVLLEDFKHVEIRLMGQRQAQAKFSSKVSLWISVLGALTILAMAIVLLRVASSLRNNSQNLEQQRSQLEGQDWVKTNFSVISARLSGLKDLQACAEVLMNELVPMVGAHLGLFYQSQQHAGQPTRLCLLGSYAYQAHDDVPQQFSLGEGLVGQSALEKKSILLENAPSDYIRISSASGSVRPNNIMLFPVVFEGQLLAVVEIASSQCFSPLQRALMEQVENNIGVIFNAILANMHTEALLKQSQTQEEQLRSQQEELTTANDDLLAQTQRLKHSEEELKQQSEELQVSNEELEEKQQALQQQKEKVEQAKQELEVKAQQLVLASQYKSEFLANMSHELRTPLNSLLLLSKSLADNKQGNLSAEQVEDAMVISDGGHDLLALINDIMDLSKVEAGMLSVHIESLNLDAMSRNLQRMFDPLATDRSLQFGIEIARNLPATMIGDAQRIEQILKNLLSNAMKFTERGSVTLKIMSPSDDVVFQHARLDSESAMAFAVIDTGVGIPLDKQQAIFEAFQQQDGSTSRRYGGTGLGLTISKELARLLGGEIQVCSEEGAGSTFTLYLPKELSAETVAQARGRAHDAQHSASAKVNEGMLAPLSGPLRASAAPVSEVAPASEQFIGDDRRNIIATDKILLIIDDDKKFAKILRNHGRNNDYKCLVAGDGRSGLLLATQFQPSGILLDIGLPDIDGHHVLEQLKFNLRTRHIPVQIISGHDEAHHKILQQGAMGFLMKPVMEQQLNSVLVEIASIGKSDARKILIVEDDKGSQRAVAGLLKSSASAITCVASGKDAIKEILFNEYDCVILDIGLPDISGFEVLKQINEQQSRALPPIIIYTGKELSDDENAQLEKYSASIVVKGAGSPERLLDETSLFMHSIETKLQNGTQQTIRMLHDEDAMLKDRKILLVDDDMRNTYALSKKLIEVGLNVEMAKHGQEALEQLNKDGDYELVLMDIMMPVMDGYEATRHIRKMQQYKDVPIVALTAKAMQEDRDKCLAAGASEYLVKPIDFDKLLSIMRIWLFKHS
ncbi:MAG: CHASE3 domain-containing protein [Bermanella sp.]